MCHDGSPPCARPSDFGISARGPYTPRTNGKAERFIQTLLREWAYVTAYPSSATRRAQRRHFLRFYNRRRPHASLNYLAPWSRLPSAA